MSISSEQATVYRGGGRRWFTKRAAAKAEARALIFRRYPCDCDKHNYDNDYSSEVCHLHAMESSRYGKLIRRVARFYLRAA